MKARFRNNLKRTIIFISALALIASSTLVTGYADDKEKQVLGATEVLGTSRPNL